MLDRNWKWSVGLPFFAWVIFPVSISNVLMTLLHTNPALLTSWSFKVVSLSVGWTFDLSLFYKNAVSRPKPAVSLFHFFFFFGTGVWTQGLILAKQTLPFVTPPVLFYFSDRVLCFCPLWPGTDIWSFYLFCIPGITILYHHGLLKIWLFKKP
jgi:hypothetical protein